MYNKKNTPLVLGFAIPVFMILLVVLSIYLPRLFMNPMYNFLYSSDSGATVQYEVQGEHLMQKTYNDYYPAYAKEAIGPTLYIYDVKSDTSKVVDFSIAQTLRLDPSEKSPDGYSVKTGSYSSGFFPFYSSGGGDYNSRWLVNSIASRKLNLIGSTLYSYQTFQLYGWILK